MSFRKILIIPFALPAIFCSSQTVYDNIPIDTLLFDDGTLYMGQAKDSIFNGKGTCIYTDGTVYSGDWKNGSWDGQGTLIYSDGDIYKGSFHNHIKEGKGTYIYNSGARYDGEWKNDKFNGKGKLLFEDGGVYDGLWKDDMKHGYGKLTNQYGRILTGYFYNDEYLGMPFDTYIDRDSTLSDDLKEWGFKNEPENLSTDISLALSYSTKSMATVTMWVDYFEKCFIGFSIGLNINPPTQGKQSSFSWLSYLNDIHIEGTYISSIYTIDAGLKWGKFSLGGAAGIGVCNRYMNCIANTLPADYLNGTGINIGEAYYKIGNISQSFVFRTYSRYYIYIKNRPKALIYFGYGNSEGLFLGAGLKL